MAWIKFSHVTSAFWILVLVLAGTEASRSKNPADKLVVEKSDEEHKTVTDTDRAARLDDKPGTHWDSYGDLSNEEDVTQDPLYYVGAYKGTCADNGIYYKSEFSFVICNHGLHYTQPCPAGTKNKNISQFTPHTMYKVSPFCSVNLNDFGYTVSKSESLDKYAMHTRRVGGPLLSSDAHRGTPHGKSRTSFRHATSRNARRVSSYATNTRGVPDTYGDYKAYKVIVPDDQIVEYIPSLKGYHSKKSGSSVGRHSLRRKGLMERSEQRKGSDFDQVPSERRPGSIGRSESGERRKHTPRFHEVERSDDDNYQDEFVLPDAYYDGNRDESGEIANDWRLPSREIYSREYRDGSPRKYMNTEHYDDYSSNEGIKSPLRTSKKMQHRRPYRSRKTAFYPESRPYDSASYHDEAYPNQSGEFFAAVQHGFKRGSGKPEARSYFDRSPPGKHPMYDSNKDGYHAPVYWNRQNQWRKDLYDKKGSTDDSFKSSFMKANKPDPYFGSASVPWTTPQEYGKWTTPKGFYSSKMLSSKEISEMYPKGFFNEHEVSKLYPKGFLSKSDYKQDIYPKGSFDKAIYKQDMKRLYPEGFFDGENSKQGSAGKMDFDSSFWKDGSSAKDGYTYPSYKDMKSTKNPSLILSKKNPSGKDILVKNLPSYQYANAILSKQSIQGKSNQKGDNRLTGDLSHFPKSVPHQRKSSSFGEAQRWRQFPKNEPLHSGKATYLSDHTSLNGLMKGKGKGNIERQYALGKNEVWRKIPPLSSVTSGVIGSRIRHDAKRVDTIQNQKNNHRAFPQGSKHMNLMEGLRDPLPGFYSKNKPSYEMDTKGKVDWKDWLTNLKEEWRENKDGDSNDRDGIGNYGRGFSPEVRPAQTFAQHQEAKQTLFDTSASAITQKFIIPESKIARDYRLNGGKGKDLGGYKEITISLKIPPNRNSGNTQISDQKANFESQSNQDSSSDYDINDFDINRVDGKTYLLHPPLSENELASNAESSDSNAEDERQDVFENGRERDDLFVWDRYMRVGPIEANLPEIITTTQKYTSDKMATPKGHKLRLTAI